MVKPHRSRVVILGSTGSIGTQALDVIRAHPDLFEVVGLGAGSRRSELDSQAREFGVTATGIGTEDSVQLAALPEADVVLNGIVGAAGLRASITALENGKVLALANKESLVAGGELCRLASERGGGSIRPVDSEHAALEQCLQGRDRAEILRLVLTASGGPFRDRTDLSEVTPKEALAHPTWQMGERITIDSATLMNKGLEVIEAHHLFGFDYDRIDVVVHPQSAVHAVVDLIDGSTLMQAAPTDMRIPIQGALSAARLDSQLRPLDLAEQGQLTFEAVDHERFPCLGLAYEAGRKAMTYPAALNAADEIAVGAFLEGRITFTSIPRVVESVLDAHDPGDATDLDTVLEVDRWARDEAESVVGRAGAGGAV